MPSTTMSGQSPLANHAHETSRGEWHFLVECVGRQLAGAGAGALAMLDTEGLSWNTILQIAEANRVVPLLSAMVRANQVGSVPPEVAADLTSRFRYYAQRGMAFVFELRNVLGALNKANVRCIPLKGPVLTVGSYGKLGLRDFDDLDLLVAPEDVSRAVVALAELGYCGWDVPEHRISSHLRTECEHNLPCKERGFTIDLHWAIGRKYFTMPMEFEELWSRSARTKLIGSPVPDLCAEDMVLFLCYHGGKHLFTRLSWVCDIAATIAAHPDLDWDALLAKATLMGARRLLLLGLCLAQVVLRSDLPIRVDQLIQSESALQSLASAVLRGIAGEASPKSALRQQIEASVFHLRVRERTSDRLRYLFWAAAPNTRDWHDSRLPQSLSFLLVLRRPIRLLRKTRAA